MSPFSRRKLREGLGWAVRVGRTFWKDQMDDNEIRTGLLAPERLYGRDELLGSACLVPRAAGVYAWFFRQVPDVVPTEGCLTHEGMTLLYVGISPDKQESFRKLQTTSDDNIRLTAS